MQYCQMVIVSNRCYCVLLISAAKIIDIGFGLNKQIIEMSTILVTTSTSISYFRYWSSYLTWCDTDLWYQWAIQSLLAVSTTNFISFLLVWFKSKIIPFSKKTLIILAIAYYLDLHCIIFCGDRKSLVEYRTEFSNYEAFILVLAYLMT